jgi:hypothetical protein
MDTKDRHARQNRLRPSRRAVDTYGGHRVRCHHRWAAVVGRGALPPSSHGDTR